LERCEISGKTERQLADPEQPVKPVTHGRKLKFRLREADVRRGTASGGFASCRPRNPRQSY